MAGFYKLMRRSLRSAEAGADTIAWLASSTATASKRIESGSYCWDRAARRIDLPLSGTRASETDVDDLVAYQREATGAVAVR